MMKKPNWTDEPGVIEWTLEWLDSRTSPEDVAEHERQTNLEIGELMRDAFAGREAKRARGRPKGGTEAAKIYLAARDVKRIRDLWAKTFGRKHRGSLAIEISAFFWNVDADRLADYDAKGRRQNTPNN